MLEGKSYKQYVYIISSSSWTIHVQMHDGGYIAVNNNVRWVDSLSDIRSIMIFIDLYDIMKSAQRDQS